LSLPQERLDHAAENLVRVGTGYGPTVHEECGGSEDAQLPRDTLDLLHRVRVRPRGETGRELLGIAPYRGEDRLYESQVELLGELPLMRIGEHRVVELPAPTLTS